MVLIPKDVEIGFTEECESWRLESRFFPNKIGGKPAWLDLENLPCVDSLQCNTCKKQLIFLCQIYAPYDEDELNFHRTLFIFVCRSSTCMQSKEDPSVKVFRSHLPQVNKFYPSEPPEDSPSLNFTITEWVKLCTVCGSQAQKHCSKCKEVYCCREHQVTAWKEGHKIECGNSALKTLNSSNLLFSEFELVVEPEVLDNNVVDESKELEEFRKLQLNGEVGTMQDIPEADLEAHASIEADKTFMQFQKRVRNEPEQVVRYQRGGDPLWIAKSPVPDTIPNCEYCQGPRQFEFQIMPQMLVMLKETVLDWGVLCIYTCKRSCTDVHAYKEEYIFKQDISQ